MLLKSSAAWAALDVGNGANLQRTITPKQAYAAG